MNRNELLLQGESWGFRAGRRTRMSRCESLAGLLGSVEQTPARQDAGAGAARLLLTRGCSSGRCRWWVGKQSPQTYAGVRIWLWVPPGSDHLPAWNRSVIPAISHTALFWVRFAVKIKGVFWGSSERLGGTSWDQRMPKKYWESQRKELRQHNVCAKIVNREKKAATWIPVT